MRHIAALSIGLLVLGQNATAWAAEGSTPEQVAYGAGSFFGTLLYSPVKASFCILGALASPFAIPFGGTKTAGKVVGTTCRGTWVITPANLKGRERVEFMGHVSVRPTPARGHAARQAASVGT